MIHLWFQNLESKQNLVRRSFFLASTEMSDKSESEHGTGEINLNTEIQSHSKCKNLKNEKGIYKLLKRKKCDKHSEMSVITDFVDETGELAINAGNQSNLNDMAFGNEEGLFMKAKRRKPEKTAGKINHKESLKMQVESEPEKLFLNDPGRISANTVQTKRGKRKKHEKTAAKKEYKQHLVNKLRKAGCALPDLAQDINVADLEYVECTQQFQTRSVKSKKTKKMARVESENTFNSQSGNHTTSNSKSGQVKKRIHTEDMVNDLSIQTNSCPILTRSKAVVLKIKPSGKPDTSSGGYLARATVGDIPGDHHSYKSYKLNELARALAWLKWEKDYGRLNEHFKVDVSKNVDENAIPNIWDMDEKQVKLFQDYFPMPYVKTSSNINVDNITGNQLYSDAYEAITVDGESAESSDQQICHTYVDGSADQSQSTNSLLQNLYNGISPEKNTSQRKPTPKKYLSPACLSNTTDISVSIETKKDNGNNTLKKDLAFPCCTEINDIPISNEKDISQNGGSSSELSPINEHVSSPSTLFMYNGNICYKRCTVVSDDTPYSFFPDNSHTNSRINPKEILFWKSLSLLHIDIIGFSTKVQSVKSMLNTGQKFNEAKHVMLKLSSEIGHLSSRMKNLKNDNCVFGIGKKIPHYLKTLDPSIFLTDYAKTKRCFKRIKRDYRQTNNKLTSAINATDGRAATLSSTRKLVTSDLEKQGLWVTNITNLPLTLGHSSQKSLGSKAKPKKTKAAKTLTERVAHVMSEKETQHWARLQELFMEMEETMKTFRKRMFKLQKANNFEQFDSDVDDVAYMKGLHTKVSEFLTKINAEKKESTDFCYSTVRDLPELSKRKARLSVTTFKQVETLFYRFRHTFVNLTRRFGYDHLISDTS